MCRNRVAGEAIRILPQGCAGLFRMKTHAPGCASKSSPLGQPVASSSVRRLQDSNLVMWLVEKAALFYSGT